MSARSLRKAWNRGSGWLDGPGRPNGSALVREDGGPFLGGRPVEVGRDPFFLAEVEPEAFKKFGPAVGPHHEDVAAVVLVSFAAELAEPAERIQGASDDRLRNPEKAGQAAHGVGAGGQIDEQQKRHLAVGEVGFPGPYVADQGLHP